MADVDIDPFGDHELRTEEATGEDSPLNPVAERQSWEPECVQETSFREETQERRLTNSYVHSLYKELSRNYIRISDATHYDRFKREGMPLYFKRREDEPLTNEDGKLKKIGQLTRILGKKELVTWVSTYLLVK